MKKSNLVYIDFEAITNPFARIIKMPSGIPYCFSLGLFNEKNKFRVSTFIMDFKKHHNVEGIWNVLRKIIIDNIKSINPNINIKEVVFVGHNPVLEQKCIKKMFPENQVVPLLKHPNISLSKLTAKEFNDEYFAKTKKTLEKFKDLNENIHKTLFIRNGAIASFAGYWLFVEAIKNLRSNDRRLKYFLPLDKALLKKELKKYSKDDVLKMLYMSEHLDEQDDLVKEVAYKQELLKQIKNLDLDDKLTIKEIKENIWKL
ncbi:DUF2779 domain-containing protein [[Mycoplasma] anseris]|uniref:DUF2779 domain-containing protein n=1 Tax=[Mycoplasma] anseris TaxID=92400 RepID=A0A2Z4NDB7_9BACT|nr:DUF2779 domain-containing protein [[Mycoplasma] anseris]AWX69581.1 DUF2779 domain-containing protein [[Mycoplasma] anseris]